MTERPQPLVEAVESGLAGLDLHVYDVEILGNGPTQILRVTIDRDGGVDLDAITAATEALSGVLDHDTAAASALRGSYTLEVTSPGLERALRTPEHFRRAVGAIVSVKTGSGADARRRRGTLVAADDGGFDLAADDGTSEHLAYDEVVKARTVFEWGPESKPKRKGKRASRHKVSS
ncbi:MAG: ribosome maturation factor RimP [Acidimicrobiia bacterium]